MHRVVKQAGFFIFIFLLLLTGTTSTYGSTVYVSVASSMTDVFREISREFSAKYPDVRLLANYASSGSLAKQIAQGAPADLYISANPKWVDYLIEQEIVDKTSKKILAFNKLVFVGQPELDTNDISQLISLDKIAIGSPQNVPAGQYAKEAMQKSDIYSLLSSEKKLVMAKDVRQALIYADNGIVDGAFVYQTDALLAKNASILFVVPDELYSHISYPLVLTSYGRKKPEATLLMNYMKKPEVLEILEKHGFEVERE